MGTYSKTKSLLVVYELGDSLGSKNCKYKIDKIYSFLYLLNNKLTIKMRMVHQFYTSNFMGPNSPDTPNSYTAKQPQTKKLTRFTMYTNFLWIIFYAKLSRNLYFTIVKRNGKIIWKHGPHLDEFDANLKFLGCPEQLCMNFFQNSRCKMILILLEL